MKKKHKSNRLFVFVLNLFILTGFYSCDKTDTLEYTTWESDYFEVEYKDAVLPSHPYYLDEELILRGKMYISFEEKNDATFTTEGLQLYDRKNDIIYYEQNYKYQSATYIYDRKNLTLTFESSKLHSFSGQTWAGKVNKTTMDLKIVFGETVRFNKK